ncbi:hypothetical protein [Fimbriimonas ginsengisoli]|uniref:Uncharacterized protein n=1 Tax=Fimbriimonas ginsengisoli Gsoil 348 TaxID=661478 RepID=A0A068NWI0_FIMGI|nr:hypothetical protein [Fimbriimonas ginsengisoli]AIE87722.1 hypothetical protein OP10G_4354 [Fimbriimonas ginsengisoli Gsoil 348]
MIPIVAILTSHQQKMARIIHEARPQTDSTEISALRQEVRELKELIHTQMLALDAAQSRPPARPVDAGMQERLRTGG